MRSEPSSKNSFCSGPFPLRSLRSHCLLRDANRICITFDYLYFDMDARQRPLVYRYGSVNGPLRSGSQSTATLDFLWLTVEQRVGATSIGSALCSMLAAIAGLLVESANGLHFCLVSVLPAPQSPHLRRRGYRVSPVQFHDDFYALGSSLVAATSPLGLASILGPL